MSIVLGDRPVPQDLGPAGSDRGSWISQGPEGLGGFHSLIASSRGATGGCGLDKTKKHRRGEKAVAIASPCLVDSGPNTALLSCELRNSGTVSLTCFVWALLPTCCQPQTGRLIAAADRLSTANAGRAQGPIVDHLGPSGQSARTPSRLRRGNGWVVGPSVILCTNGCSRAHCEIRYKPCLLDKAVESATKCPVGQYLIIRRLIIIILLASQAGNTANRAPETAKFSCWPLSRTQAAVDQQLGLSDYPTVVLLTLQSRILCNDGSP